MASSYSSIEADADRLAVMWQAGSLVCFPVLHCALLLGSDVTEPSQEGGALKETPFPELSRETPFPNKPVRREVTEISMFSAKGKI